MKGSNTTAVVSVANPSLASAPPNQGSSQVTTPRALVAGFFMRGRMAGMSSPGNAARLFLVFFGGMVILGCVDSTAPNRNSSTGGGIALKAARQWVIDQGGDPSSSEFSAESDGAGWSVLIQRLPPTPGAHTFLRIDSKGKVIEVIPGA
jgi:hypothetical protein